MSTTVNNLLDASLWGQLQYELGVIPFTYSGATSDRRSPSYYRYDVIDSPTARKDVITSGPLLYRKLFKALQAKLPQLQAHVPTRIYYNRQYYGMEANIHKDCPTEYTEDLTVVVYVEPTWDIQHGGETLVFAAAGQTFSQYRPNSCVMFASNISHKANYISKECKAPRTVLTFKCRPVSKIEEFLSATSFDKVTHGKENLQQHLLRTGYTVKALGTETEATVLAAFLHSTLSTEFFKLEQPLSVEQLTKEFGSEVADLVTKFSQLPRQELLDGKHGQALKVIAETNAKVHT